MCLQIIGLDYLKNRRLVELVSMTTGGCMEVDAREGV
jgi:hypothetical protein